MTGEESVPAVRFRGTASTDCRPRPRSRFHPAQPWIPLRLNERLAVEVEGAPPVLAVAKQGVSEPHHGIGAWEVRTQASARGDGLGVVQAITSVIHSAMVALTSASEIPRGESGIPSRGAGLCEMDL